MRCVRARGWIGLGWGNLGMCVAESDLRKLKPLSLPPITQ